MKKRCSILFLAMVPFSGWTLQAQIASSHIAEGGKMYGDSRTNLLAMAEKMPDADYNFKPTPDIRTFGEVIAHIADTQAMICSAVTGQKKTVNAAAKTAKGDLVAALKESFSICDSAWDSLTDASAAQTVKMGPMNQSRLGMMEINTVHNNEEYGYLSVYLRLKGVVPPSSAGQSR